MEIEKITSLVRRAKAGDKGAANEILKLFHPLIQKAAGQAHLHAVREDAAQEAAIALLWSVANFDESRGVPFAGFAKRMVFGRVRTFFLREQRRWQREILPFPAESEDGDKEGFFESVADERDEIGAVDKRDAFRARNSSLAARGRIILSLYYEGGLALREIGNLLHIRENAVSVCKSRAVAKLRREICGGRLRQKAKRKRCPKGRRNKP